MDENKLVELVVTTTINVLEKRGLIDKNKRSAFQRTEQLLYNYCGFKRIVQDKLQDIEDIKRYGVPQRVGSVGERVQTSIVQTGLRTHEESVEAAVQTLQRSVDGTVQVISMIDNAMERLKFDPYYKVLEMRYFEGRTQEDIALEYGCSQVTISNNKNRLVRELAMRLFPELVARELIEQ